MVRSPWARGIALVAGLAAFAAAAVFGARLLTTGPGVVFLSDARAAHWIQLGTPHRPIAYAMKRRAAVFRLDFHTSERVDRAILEFRALRAAGVMLDGRELSVGPMKGSDWRTLRRVELARRLEPGDHSLVVIVESNSSPAMLWARSDALPLATGANWLASRDLVSFRPALVARDGPKPFAVSREFPSVAAAMWQCLPALLPVFLGVAWWSSRNGRSGDPHATGGIAAAHVRWALIAAWGALLLNNIAVVPARVGMDVDLHMDYVRYLVAHRSIPLATQGGEMMQAPLAYLILAPFYAWLAPILSEFSILKVLRVLPFACGLAQVELCYRAARAVYPGRPDLQIAGTLFGGLLPVNLVLAQAVANEPVAAVTGGCVALLGLRMALDPESPGRRRLVVLGLAFGMALLSKVTAVLLAPPIFVVLALRSRQWRAIAMNTAWFLAPAAVVSAWYYLRNWILMGSPFLGTWNAGVASDWWQDPGFRMSSQFLRFGEALTYPVFAAAVGFWDGLYSSLWLDGNLSGIAVRNLAPPWNYDFMLATAGLSLLPTAALAIGGLLALRRARPAPGSDAAATAASHTSTAQRFALACVGCYLGALLVLNIRVPFYCVAKSSYLVATTPCLAVVGAAGFEWLGRNRVARPCVQGLLAAWAVAAYAGYFVV